jgi:hypothetical protein
MKIIHHKGRPVTEFPEERWRPSLRLAFNRSVPGHETLEMAEAKKGMITN